MTDLDRARMLDDARITPGFAVPPYSVETYPIGACIVNSQGMNVLRFKSKLGAKFTSPEAAELICAQWNDAADIGEQMP